MVKRIVEYIRKCSLSLSLFLFRAKQTLTLAFGSLSVRREQEVSRIAEETFSRRRNDNPRFKIHLRERDGEKKETRSLSSRAKRNRDECGERADERGKKGERSEKESREEEISERRTGRDCRKGEEGIKLRFNFAAISQARVARRDTPNIRRNLHFKLETSCDGPRGFRCRRHWLQKASPRLRDREFVRKIVARAITPVLQMRGYHLRSCK